MNLIDLGNADALAAAKAKAASSSFYWAMRALPRAKRQSMYAIYAFCREVDDIADSEGPPEAKRRSLERWRANVERLFRPESVPVFLLEAPLRRAVELHGLRRRDFMAIIDGMMMDADTIHAPTLAELDLYCDRVASSVGRLSVKVFGLADPEGEALAVALGRALQLTNILRDLGDDSRMGRLYLPREMLDRHGIDSAHALSHPALPAACLDLAAMARAHYTQAWATARQCPRDAIRPAMVMGAIYEALLDRLLLEGWRHPDQRVDIGTSRKLWLMLRHGAL